MAKPDEKFIEFLETVDAQLKGFVVEVNDYLTQNNCKSEINPAKQGFTVSYKFYSTKKVLATFVFRKTGIKLRIYPEHLNAYGDFLNTLPDKMKNEIKKASVCKRLIDPNDCNPKCIKGYDFFMDNEHHQKCRYMAFMPTLSQENNPHIKAFLQYELNAQ